MLKPSVPLVALLFVVTFLGFVPNTPADAASVGLPRPEYLRDCYSHERPLRAFNYGYVGVGAGTNSVTQLDHKTSSSSVSYGGGVELNSRFNPLGLEISGRSTGTGDAAASSYKAMVFYNLPLFDLFSPERAQRKEDGHFMDGLSREDLYCKHGEETEAYFDRFSPMTLQIGVGYGGLSVAQKNGTQRVVGSDNVGHANAKGEFTGIPVTARLTWFGKQTMVRAAVTCMSGSGSIGGKEKADLGFGPEDITFSTNSKGRAMEYKIDVYHADLERQQADKFFTGFGVTLAYRNGSVDGQIFDKPTSFYTSRQIEVPTMNFQQVELLFSTGIMY